MSLKPLNATPNAVSSPPWMSGVRVSIDAPLELTRAIAKSSVWPLPASR